MRNGNARPPAPEFLNTCRQETERTTGPKVDLNSPATTLRAPRNSVKPPSEANATATMYRYYTADWQAVLKNAKNIYRLWLGTVNPYPSPAQGYEEGREAVNEAVIIFKRESGVLSNDGTSLNFVSHHMFFIAGGQVLSPTTCAKWYVVSKMWYNLLITYSTRCTTNRLHFAVT